MGELESMSNPPPVTQAQGGTSSWSTVFCSSSNGYVARELWAVLGTDPFISSKSTLLHGVSALSAWLLGSVGVMIEESGPWLVTWSPSGTVESERSDTRAEMKLSLVILGTRGLGMSVSRTEPWEGAVTSLASLSVQALNVMWNRGFQNYDAIYWLEMNMRDDIARHMRKLHTWIGLWFHRSRAEHTQRPMTCPSPRWPSHHDENTPSGHRCQPPIPVLQQTFLLYDFFFIKAYSNSNDKMLKTIYNIVLKNSRVISFRFIDVNWFMSINNYRHLLQVRLASHEYLDVFRKLPSAVQGCKVLTYVNFFITLKCMGGFVLNVVKFC